MNIINYIKTFIKTNENDNPELVRDGYSNLCIITFFLSILAFLSSDLFGLVSTIISVILFYCCAYCFGRCSSIYKYHIIGKE
jgi:hypothetical protein